jgi:hypothetical protein
MLLQPAKIGLPFTLHLQLLVVVSLSLNSLPTPISYSLIPSYDSYTSAFAAQAGPSHTSDLTALSTRT